MLTVHLTEFSQIEHTHDTSIQIKNYSMSGIPEAFLLVPSSDRSSRGKP